MNAEANLSSAVKSALQQRSGIRFWRDEVQSVTEKMIAFPERNSRSSLRKERALSGCVGYDLNRHICLLRQRNRVAVKQKTPSLREDV